MGLDDLLGLLFLFFFVVLPALQGLLRRGKQMPPDFEPEEILLPGEERRPPVQPAQTSPSTPASPPPQPSQPPKPKAPPPRRPKSLEEIERERLGRIPPHQAPGSAQPTLAGSAPPRAISKTKPTAQWEFSATPHAILNGVVWHQVLAEPRSQYWRRARKAKR